MKHTRERMENHRNTGWHEVMHWLHDPADLGRTAEFRVRFPLLHMIHLIPSGWVERSCARYDRRRGRKN